MPLHGQTGGSNATASSITEYGGVLPN